MPRLRTFLEELPESSPVEIDGRKWSVGTRMPFPHEDLWMGRNAEMSRAE
ncbi:hypothetical protein NX02_20930 [Sphingomonas sanxanigenens DSM 19645 = NX02]|uniref:Uncharacterized protein n=1 Tax=Sphingomonas sanxanigenens DSM 19645 = NX02 TaxID=1123269 RepID=W0AH06_9SPHN|nr:hypothetical protein NX02_20930 [Sphingomonas sanxanigenens DSM 19645 = NX02]